MLTNQTQFAADTITQFVKVIRAAYVIPCKGPADPEPFRLTSRLFVPVQITNRKSETTAETVQRINAWIHAAGKFEFRICFFFLAQESADLHKDH